MESLVGAGSPVEITLGYKKFGLLTGGFIRFSLARTLTQIIFLVPCLRSPRNPEGVANQEGYLRCSKRFDHIGVTLQVLALFEFKSVDERP